MDSREFDSKTMLCYSRCNNARIDLSCLPDDIFGEVVEGTPQIVYNKETHIN